jgi:hypothetical protein
MEASGSNGFRRNDLDSTTIQDERTGGGFIWPGGLRWWW